MIPATASKIFLCYRRGDTAAYAGRLADALRGRFLDHGVFMDLEITLGEDFIEAVERAIGSCAVVLVLIGPRWLDATDNQGRRRLDDPDDLVRLEIAMALERQLVVIPLFVGGALTPREQDLPTPLRPLVRRTGFAIRDDRWDDDVKWLLESLGQRLGTPSPSPPIHRSSDDPPPVNPPTPRPPTARLRPVPGLMAQPRLLAITRSRLRIAVIAAAIVLALVAGVIALVDSPAPEVKIGAILRLTGPDRYANEEVLHGLQFAVDYLNADDGHEARLPLAAGAGLPRLDGAKLKLVPKDSGPTHCTVQPLIDQLVDSDHVAAVVGAYESTVTLRAIIAADQRHIPLVNAGSTVSSFTDPERSRKTVKTCETTDDNPRPSPWFFRVGPNDAQAARRFFALIGAAQRSGKLRRVSKVALLREGDDIYGAGAAADTKKAARKRGGIEVRDYKYKTVLGTSVSLSNASGCPLVSRIDRLVRQIQHYNPDIVFAVSYPPDAIAVVQTMKLRGYVPPALLAYGSGYLDDTFIKGVKAGHACGLLPADPAGIIAHTAWSSKIRDQSTTAQHIAERFAQRYKRPMTSRAAVGFTALLALAQAINNAGSTDPKKIQAALRTLDVPADATIMPWNGIKFDEYGQNTRVQVILEQAVAGHYRVVYPNGHAAHAAIWPLSKAGK